jgi:hypothetical protein
LGPGVSVVAAIVSAAGQDQQKAAPLGLFVLLLLCVACFFLFRSMSRHLKRVRDDFPSGPSSPAPTSRPTARPPAAGPSATGSAVVKTLAAGSSVAGSEVADPVADPGGLDAGTDHAVDEAPENLRPH